MYIHTYMNVFSKFKMASEVKKKGHQHKIYFCGTLNVNKIIKLLTFSVNDSTKAFYILNNYIYHFPCGRDLRVAQWGIGRNYSSSFHCLEDWQVNE